MLRKKEKKTRKSSKSSCAHFLILGDIIAKKFGQTELRSDRTEPASVLVTTMLQAVTRGSILGKLAMLVSGQRQALLGTRSQGRPVKAVSHASCCTTDADASPGLAEIWPALHLHHHIHL